MPSRARGAVRPPPSLSPDDVPAVIEVPRMSPPPPSLGALVDGGGRRRKQPAPRGASSSYWPWAVAAVAIAALAAYLLR